MAQQARPNVTGQIDERRAHCTIFSTVVVRTGISASRPIGSPLEHALAPDVDVPGRQEEHEEHDLYEPVPPEIAKGHRPRIEERDLDVEEQEDHRDEIELDGLSFTRIPHGRHPALIRRSFLPCRFARTEKARQEGRNQREPCAERDHQEYGEPALHVWQRPTWPGLELVNDFASSVTCYRTPPGKSTQTPIRRPASDDES